MRDVERELEDRYMRHYRVICLRSSEEARARLEELAAGGEDVALVLAGQTLSGLSGSELLAEARRLHPHAKRGLLIPWGGWGEQATGDAIFGSIARGRIDHYVLRPQGIPGRALPPGGVEHAARVDGGAARRPLTIHVVGESWSGRAYEIRDMLQRCAIPHSFCLANSSDGRALLAEAGTDARLRSSSCPTAPC